MNIPLRQYWDLLAGHIKPHKAGFLMLTALLLSSTALQIVNPQIMRSFIDAAQSGALAQRLLMVALLFVGMALLQQVVSVAATYVGENVAWIATNELRAELACHCLYLDMSFHNERSPGELIERIDGDVAQLSNFFSQLVVRVFGNLLLLLGVLVAVCWEDWRTALILAVFSALTLYVLYRIRGIAVPYDKARRQAEADLFGFLEERLAGTEDIRSSGAVDFVLRGLYKLQYAILQHWAKARLRSLLVSVAGGLLQVLGTVIAIVWGYTLYRGGTVTIGTVYLLVYYVNLMGQPIRDLTQQVENLQTIGASTARLSELKGIESKTRDGPRTQVSEEAAALAFDNVSFAYVEGEPVLRRVSFSLRPGSVVGLLGRTGSGKTTLARLVFRLYDPTAGQVVLDGTSVREFSLKALRQRVAMVTQEVQLFQANVRDNLTFFDRTIPDDRILAAIQELELGDWYQSLPRGLDTQIESGGHGLSAGEAQLLAFTRIFLRDPGLVILDEASSRLDPVTERRIERAVDKLLRNRTAIIIAHRLGTVLRADEVMILDEGLVVEYGERQALAGDPSSRFCGLLRTGLEEVLI